MSWDGIIIAAATVLSAVVGRHWYRSRTNPFRWKLLQSGDIPMWVIHRIYKNSFIDRSHPITKTRFFFKGAIFEYSVRVKDPTISEPIANVCHLEVFRRRQRGR